MASFPASSIQSFVKLYVTTQKIFITIFKIIAWSETKKDVKEAVRLLHLNLSVSVDQFNNNLPKVTISEIRNYS